MTRPEVVLTPDIKRELFVIARGRNDRKLAAQSRKVMTKMTNLEVNNTGVKGEYVASRVTGRPFDTQSYGMCGDTGVDLVLGRTLCSVKTNHRRGGYLLIERKSDLDPKVVSIAILVDGRCAPRQETCLCTQVTTKFDVLETWRVAGWIPVHQFWARCKLRDWGLGPRWYVEQSELCWDIEELLEATRVFDEAVPAFTT